MNPEVKRFMWDIAFLVIFFAAYLVVHNYVTKSTASKYWKAENEANNKRLFGDAWDSLP